MIANLMVRYSESMAIETDTAHICLNMTSVIIQVQVFGVGRTYCAGTIADYSMASNTHICGGYSSSPRVGHGLL